MDIAIGGWILVAVGLLLAFTGTKLFWLAVGIAGFAFGWLVTLALFPTVDPLISLVAGLVLGIACAVVAVKGLPIISVILAAVLVGLFGLTLARLLFDDNTAWNILGFVVGAAIGYFIVKISLDFGIALVTALGGATMVWNGIVDSLPDLTRVIATIAALATFIFGFLAQQAQRRNAQQTAA
jgi:membrane-associated HD superfamily phosphohydrolase